MKLEDEQKSFENTLDGMELEIVRSDAIVVGRPVACLGSNLHIFVYIYICSF